MLRLTCGDAVLTLATAADDDALVALLPDDFDHDPTYPTVEGRSLQAHREAWFRSWLAGFRDPANRCLAFVVSCDGEPVGFQVLERPDLPTVDSSSFLIPGARGRRLGVAMRWAVLALAFERLGATRAVTAARPDNIASQQVSARAGYNRTGESAPLVAGAPRTLVHYEITADTWRELDHLPVTIEGELPWTP